MSVLPLLLLLLQAPLGEAPDRPETIYNLAVLPVTFGENKTDSFPLVFQKGVRNYFGKESAGKFRLPVKRYDGMRLNLSREALGKIPIRSSGETEVFRRILRGWMNREGAGVPALHDGVAFLVEGRIGARGYALWPHQGSLRIGRMKIDYVVMPSEAGKHTVGIAAHEFGHLLGLKDRYDMKRRCLMGTGYGADDPAPLCIFCRAELGWVTARNLPLPESEKFILAKGEVLRVAINPAGTEKMVLAVRDGKLEVWRELRGRDREHIGLYPSESRDRCTPLSLPGFIGSSVGARETWLTDIRFVDGSALFLLADHGTPTPSERERQKSLGQTLGR